MQLKVVIEPGEDSGFRTGLMIHLRRSTAQHPRASFRTFYQV